MRQDLIDLFDRYTHGRMSRRGFIARLTRLAGSAAAAGAALSLLETDHARAETVAESDSRIVTERSIYASGVDWMAGYEARPRGEGPFPAVLVIHENKGLNPHIEDVARRFALEGFLALAPDILAPAPYPPRSDEEARDMIYALPEDEALQRLLSSLAHIRAQPRSNGRTGAVGFCWGGTMANRLAVADPHLDAAVAYYGGQPEAAGAADIEAALLLHYAERDERVNRGIDAWRAALESAEVEHQIHVYEGAQHAFNNDANAARYDADAARLAWRRTIAFLNDKLIPPPPRRT